MTTCTNCSGAIFNQQDRGISYSGLMCRCQSLKPPDIFTQQNTISLASINRKLDDILILLYRLKIDKYETTQI